jgi:hypothetical protein
MKAKFAVAALVAAASAIPAHATDYVFSYAGGGVSGSIMLTYGVNPNTGVLPGTSPNPVDPIGSYIITGISGTFSDANIGISNAAITGIVLSNPANPEPTNLAAPHSFGFYNGLFSYDNLFYPGGSPAASTDYTVHGGFLDIYGMVFTIAGDKAVNFWSDGDFGGGPTYGVGVTDGTNVLDYVAGGVAVPEPASWALMVIGFGALGAAVRRRRQAAVA